MGTEDDHVANEKGVGSKKNLESIRSDPNMGNWRIGQNTNGNRWKNAGNVGNNGKRQKQRKTSETAENVGKRQKMLETSELELVEIWYMTAPAIHAASCCTVVVGADHVTAAKLSEQTEVECSTFNVQRSLKLKLNLRCRSKYVTTTVILPQHYHGSTTHHTIQPRRKGPETRVLGPL